jgi:hypothetical protein
VISIASGTIVGQLADSLLGILTTLAVQSAIFFAWDAWYDAQQKSQQSKTD